MTPYEARDPALLAPGDAGAPAPLPPKAARRSLAPREHGAYGQLAAPLVAALAMGRPGLGSWLLTAGAASAFAAQEPLRVALGHRGRRAQREDGLRALRAGIALVGLALGCGAASLLVLPQTARNTVALPAALALVATGFVGAKQEKSLAGELVAALTLASVGVPVALAGGVALAMALVAWGSWSVGFVASTFAVRSVIHHARTTQPLWRRALAPALLGLGGGLLVATGMAPSWSLVAASPLLVASLGVAVWPPPPRHLKRVGWALVAATMLGVALLVRV